MVQIGRGHNINELPNANLPFYSDIDVMLDEALAGQEITPRAQLNVIDNGMLASARALYEAPGDRPVQDILKEPNVITYGSRKNKLFLPAPQVIADYFNQSEHPTSVGIRVGIEALKLESNLGVISKLRPKIQSELQVLYDALERVVENQYGPGQWRRRPFLTTNTPLLAALGVQQAGKLGLPYVAYKNLRLFREEWKANGMASTDYPPALGALAIGIRDMQIERTADVMFKALGNGKDPNARMSIEHAIITQHGDDILNLAKQFATELPEPQPSEPVYDEIARERIQVSRSAPPTATRSMPPEYMQHLRRVEMTRYDKAVLDDPNSLMASASEALNNQDLGGLLLATMALSEQYYAGESIAVQAYPQLWQLVRVTLFNHVYRNSARISEGRVTPAEAQFIKAIHAHYNSEKTGELYASLEAGALKRYNADSRAPAIRKLITEAYVYNILNATAVHAVESRKDRLLLAKIQTRRAAELPGLMKEVNKAGLKAHRFAIPEQVTSAVEDAKRKSRELRHILANPRG